MAETPNPERRSDAALLCFGIGVALAGLSWLLGVGSVLTAALSGGSPVAIAGSVAAMIALLICGALGFVFMAIGGLWLVVRVIMDQRQEQARDRYSRDVER